MRRIHTFGAEEILLTHFCRFLFQTFPENHPLILQNVFLRKHKDRGLSRFFKAYLAVFANLHVGGKGSVHERNQQATTCGLKARKGRAVQQRRLQWSARQRSWGKFFSICTRQQNISLQQWVVRNAVTFSNADLGINAYICI